MSTVGENGSVFYNLNVFCINGFHTSSDGDEDITQFRGFFHLHYLMAIHCCL
jgi:hypothetical protein